jgi:hypothetical protein
VGRDPRHRLEVGSYEARHVGPLDLDHNLFAGSQPGGVHLGDRRRRQRGLVDPLEHLVQWTPEVLLDRGPHGVERLRLDLVAALLELRDQLIGEQALAGGDDLAELDVARSERLGRDP